MALLVRYHKKARVSDETISTLYEQEPKCSDNIDKLFLTYYHTKYKYRKKANLVRTRDAKLGVS